MGFTLFDLTYSVAVELGAAVEGTATGGNSTTIVDTVGLQDSYPDDHFNGGAAWILYDAGGAGAAPQGEYKRVSDFAKTSGTATLASALTAGVAASDRYALMTKYFPLDTLISQINRALRDVWVRTEDATTLDTASAQTEYTLPSTITDQAIEVWLQGQTGDANDNRWVRWHDWYIADPARGSSKLLIFRNQPPSPYDIKLVYYGPHPKLNIMTDKLSESVHIDRVVIPAAYNVLLWKQQQKGVADPELNQKIAIYAARSAEAIRAHPVRRESDSVKLNTLGAVDNGPFSYR